MSLTNVSNCCSIDGLAHQRDESLAKVYIEGLPAQGLVSLHARGGNNNFGQTLKFDAPVEAGDSQVGKCCLRTDAMVSVPVAEEAYQLETHCSTLLTAFDSMVAHTSRPQE